MSTPLVRIIASAIGGAVIVVSGDAGGLSLAVSPVVASLGVTTDASPALTVSFCSNRSLISNA
jgi:hypothetical protein